MQTLCAGGSHSRRVALNYRMEKIAVLGLGRMGQGIAFRLLENGYPVTVWNRSRGKETSLLSKGAKWADSPAEAAADANVVISMVSDNQASLTVWMGENGALSQLKSGSFMIECSTLSFDHVSFLSGEAEKK
ncbi:MAG TPA: NAD(P)-binding domain-containing protein, partial [Puia sp.]|nr:NAD(P)-binding domain-containing protein [Puia sp.]